MRALVWNGDELAVEQRPRPQIAPQEALVAVELAGVCSTDLEIARGYMGFTGTLGHEFVGRVAEGPSEWVGRRVVSEINFGCGRCTECRAGDGRHCEHRRVLGILDADGAFAEFVRVPVANLHAVPDRVANEAAVFCEPVAAAFEILEQLPLRKGQPTTILGDGKLGLLVAQVLCDAGARVLCVGRHPENLEILSSLGIETQLLESWQGNHRNSAEVVVEATGNSTGFSLALDAVRPRGTLVLKTTLATSPEIDLSPIVIDEIHVLGSRCGPFEPALESLAQGRIQVAPLVATRIPLDRADKALARAGEPGTRKVLIDCAKTATGHLHD